MPPTLLLVPGLVSDARVWADLAASHDGPVQAADVSRDASIHAMAERLLDETSGPLIVAGHSMGARVAMEMAHRASWRVVGLILANTGHDALQPGELARREAKIALGFADMRALCADWLPPMLAPARRADRALVTSLTEMVLAVGPEVHAAQIRALIDRPDAGAYLPEITCPILMIAGDEDGWSPPEQHYEMAALAPHAEVRIIAGAGHFMPVEKPKETTTAILDWIAQNAARLG